MSKSKAIPEASEPASDESMEEGLSPKKKKKYEDYEVEGAMSDLMRAEKHKSDPDLMGKVHALAGRHMKAVKAIRSIQDLKDQVSALPSKKKSANIATMSSMPAAPKLPKK